MHFQSDNENPVSKTADPKSSLAIGLIDEIADWLMSEALGEAEVKSLFEGCCNRLRAAGIPLWRALLTYPTLHPLYASIWLIWYRDQEMGGFESRTGYESGSEEYQKSPFFLMTNTRIPFLRRQLVGEEANLDFPVLTEFRDQGATDYLAFLMPFGAAAYEGPMINGIMTTWTTDRASGFSAADVQSLQRIEKRLAVACRVMIERQIARNILSTYLGRDAGRQVLNGQIKRGDGETIHAVIWYSDLRSSTRMADTLAPAEFLGVLNSYFECTAGAVLANDGEVLRFVGDAVLAIFPIRDGGATAQQACQAALAAARDANDRVKRLDDGQSSAGGLGISFGLGLHVGDVMYGNIGVPERLEFSVIGPSANEVARLENLTKSYDRQVLVSGEFAQHLPIAWESLGLHELRGVGTPFEVFAPPDE